MEGMGTFLRRLLTMVVLSGILAAPIVYAQRGGQHKGARKGGGRRGGGNKAPAKNGGGGR